MQAVCHIWNPQPRLQFSLSANSTFHAISGKDSVAHKLCPFSPFVSFPPYRISVPISAFLILTSRPPKTIASFCWAPSLVVLSLTSVWVSLYNRIKFHFSLCRKKKAIFKSIYFQKGCIKQIPALAARATLDSGWYKSFQVMSCLISDVQYDGMSQNLGVCFWRNPSVGLQSVLSLVRNNKYWRSLRVFARE